MIRERQALEFLATQAVSAQGPRPIATGVPHVTTVLLPDGTVRDHAIPPAPRAHSFRDLGDFCAAVNRYSVKDQTVFVSIDKAVCILCDVQDGHRENRLTLYLSPSPTFAALGTLGRAMDQKGFIQLLRTTFGACQWSNDLLNAVQTIRFTRTDDGESTVSAKGDSLGKSVKAAVSGLAAPLPDAVECSFSAFPLINHDGLRDTVSVRCALFVDHADAKLTLVPLPQAVDEAKLMAVEAVQDAITKAAKVPVYIGEP